MTTGETRPPLCRAHLRSAGVVCVGLTVVALGFNACGVITKVKNAVHDIRGNRATIDAFTTRLQSGAATTFEATYMTTGSAPATIVYAVRSLFQLPPGATVTTEPGGSS